MSLYGKNLKIGGLVCGLVLRGPSNGCYTAVFEREFANLEQLEALDWSRPEIEGDCVLPAGYGFERTGIRYVDSNRTWEVELRVAEQYLGDVTGYQAEIDGLKETVQAKTQEASEKAQEAAQAKQEAQAKTVQVKGLTTAVAAVAAISTELPDTLALEMQAAAPEAFPKWEDVLAEGKQLVQGRIIEKDGQLYHVEQAVTPQAHQVPGGDGMLAIYRPIVQGHAGTEEDPIPWAYGMDCSAGLYYTYQEHKYRVAEGGDMKPCVWPPDSGIWQWEKVD